MKFTKKKIIITAVITLALIITIGLTAVTESEEEIEEITIGYFPNVTHAPAIVGVSENIFVDHLNGVKVKTQIFPNGSLFMDALNTGQIDLGYVGPGPAINRFLQGADVRALASASIGGNVLVTHKDLDFTSIKDLDSKVVATPAIGCTHDLLFRELIKNKGINTSRRGGNIDHRAQTPATMIGLFATNQLDAAVVSEPWAARMEAEIEANVVLDWEEMPWDGRLPATILVSSQEFMDSNPELISTILEANEAAINYLNDNPEKSSEIIQAEIKELTDQELELSVISRSLERTIMSSELDENVVQELADLSHELGFINGGSDLTGFVDKSYLNSLN